MIIPGGCRGEHMRVERPAIGMFDSGVGGLGVFQAVRRTLSDQSIVYVAGNKYFPFGEKTPEQLQIISENIVNFLIEEHNVKMVVIACNTATVSSLAYLRSKFTIPFVGVVPVVKPACELTKTGCVAILSTPVTAQSAYIQELIKKFGQGKRVLSLGCPGLVDIIESGKLDTPELEILLRTFIEPALEQKADIIGLCCTHYPFMREQLQKIVGPTVTILDSNEPVAQQVKRVLALNTQPGALGAEYKFYATKDAQKFESVARGLIGDVVKDVELAVL